MQITGEITYERIHQIGQGQGQNSVVWLARDPQRNGQFAVKEIDRAKFKNDVDRCFAEARTMHAADHPNVVRVESAFLTQDLICLGMRYYQNGSLLDKIDPSPLTPMGAKRVGLKILTGLAHIHARGIIHFDLKPSNVLFSDLNEPMIADFGQARPAGPGGVAAHPGMYAEAVPPECYSGVGTFQSDIYQVGLLLYRAVNGEHYFADQRGLSDAALLNRTMRGKFPDRGRFLPHVPKQMKTVIRKALMVDPSDRYPSPADFSDAWGRADVPLDWATTVDPSTGEVEWRTDRLGQTRLVVRLLEDGPNWRTEVYTDGTGLRRLNPADPAYWARGLSRDDATTSLKTLFRTLEQR